MKLGPIVLYLSHGGGPLPLLGDESHREMVSVLKEIAALIPKPKQIILISAHWEESEVTITSGKNPSLIYDYGGFPKEAYSIKYPAPGNPDLADRIFDALKKSNIKSKKSSTRGFDHGMFVPLKVMYPDADIPTIQISLNESLDPEFHIALGESIRCVELSNTLVIGSGFSFHNMGAFFNPNAELLNKANRDFDLWLRGTLSSNLSLEEQRNRLVNWEVAAGARLSHPREEHLIPLHVCYGLAGRAFDAVYDCRILGKLATFFLWR